MNEALLRVGGMTELIVEKIHLENLHPGTQTLLFLVAHPFWILSVRRVIQRCVGCCYWCFRANPAKPPLRGDLPVFRVNQAKAFSHVGVDFAGPFSVTATRYRGAWSFKAYVCLFVCTSVKVLHLELVSSLSAEAFLAAFRRFVARLGRCSDVYSDCGTNFVGADNLLQQYSRTAAGSLGIWWHFNPPDSPHFGGLWEAGVKSVKTHLARVGGQIFTYEKLLSILTQIEAVLNSRPLCPTSADPHDLEARTPGHFLTLEPLSALPDDNLELQTLNRLSRWQLLQRSH